MNRRIALLSVALFTFCSTSQSAWSSSVDDLQSTIRASEAFLEGDYAVALREWTRLTEDGDANAPYHLGFMYLRGKGVAKDLKEAAKFFRIGAERGSDAAQNSLANFYLSGDGGMPLDKAKAAYWFRKSARQGNSLAQTSLGVMYLGGDGVLQDYSEARSLFGAAALQGDANSLFNLGLMAARGLGTEVDYVVAHMWANLASLVGHEEAEQLRETLSGLMRPQEILEAQRLAKRYLDVELNGRDKK